MGNSLGMNQGRSWAIAGVFFSLSISYGQAQDRPAPSKPAGGLETSAPQSSGPPTLTLQDALARAQKNDPAFLSSLSDVESAAEDRRQARAATLPSFGLRSDYLGTQGNGKLASGRYVTNDGVHVYREWATMHQDLSAGTFLKTGVKRAEATQALAQAKVEIARRGLTVTVTKAYYALITAQRKYASAQQALDQARRALTISRDLERGGEVAHSDVVKSQLQEVGQEQAFRDSENTMESARLDLAVLLFPNFDENFSIVDDLDAAPALPPLADAQNMAAKQDPTLRSAMAALRGADLDVTLARQAFLPQIALDPVYGIEANAIALHSAVAAAKEDGPMPNLGYFITASATLPLWDWGARSSKVKQARLKREQAATELSAAQREAVKNLRDYYGEAQTARDQVTLLRQAADLASESLRLNNLRYQAGEATILELVDAQTSLNQARNAYDDGLVRYRMALANLQTLTGAF